MTARRPAPRCRAEENSKRNRGTSRKAPVNISRKTVLMTTTARDDPLNPST